jgi:hypothetical protein
VTDATAADRFIRVHAQLHRCNVHYGVMRLDAMHRTNLMGAFIESDVCFLRELALYGTFIEVPERLFLRRYHEAASSAMTKPERVRFSLGTEGIPVRNLWHALADVRAILRAPMPAAERRQLLRWFLRRLRWDRAKYFQEMRTIIRYSLGREGR